MGLGSGDAIAADRVGIGSAGGTLTMMWTVHARSDEQAVSIADTVRLVVSKPAPVQFYADPDVLCLAKPAQAAWRRMPVFAGAISAG